MTVWIKEYERPHRFVDEQTRGPFGWWWHEHVFEQLPTGGTRMTDHVEHWPPLGVIGALADAVGLTRYMRRLLEQRNAWLKETLETLP